MKAKYEAKGLSEEFLKSEIKLLFQFSLLHLVKDMWSTFLSKRRSSKYFQPIKCRVNVE